MALRIFIFLAKVICCNFHGSARQWKLCLCVDYRPHPFVCKNDGYFIIYQIVGKCWFIRVNLTTNLMSSRGLSPFLYSWQTNSVICCKITMYYIRKWLRTAQCSYLCHGFLSSILIYQILKWNGYSKLKTTIGSARVLFALRSEVYLFLTTWLKVERLHRFPREQNQLTFNKSNKKVV